MASDEVVTVPVLRTELAAVEARLGLRIIRWVVTIGLASILAVAGLVLAAVGVGSS